MESAFDMGERSSLPEALQVLHACKHFANGSETKAEFSQPRVMATYCTKTNFTCYIAKVTSACRRRPLGGPLTGVFRLTKRLTLSELPPLNPNDPTTALLAAAHALRAAATDEQPDGSGRVRSHVRSTLSLAALIEAWCVDWAKANSAAALEGMAPDDLQDDTAVLSALKAWSRDVDTNERRPGCDS